MILTSFKTEASAVASRPSFFTADWTLENYAEVWSPVGLPAVLLELGRQSRLAQPCLGLVIAIPSAWAMAFVPGKKTKDLLMWMLSTKMMPAVAVMIPIYLLFHGLA